MPAFWTCFLNAFSAQSIRSESVSLTSITCPSREDRGRRLEWVESAAELLDVLGGRALLALHDVELHALALGERLEPRALDGRVMHEAVLLAVVARDEAEALRVVEPLHGAGRTH